MGEVLERLGLNALRANPWTAALGAAGAVLIFSPAARKLLRRGAVLTAAGVLSLADVARSAGERTRQEWSNLVSEAERERETRQSSAAVQAPAATPAMDEA